jgi:N-methylhydantoinase A
VPANREPVLRAAASGRRSSSGSVMKYMLGIDVGGTFTDFVAYNSDTKEVDVWKHLSTPGDPGDGILRGLEQFTHRNDIQNIRLGTTVATNAILERKGGVVAFVTTKGFKDVPFIQRGNRKYHYDIQWIKPKPLVKRRQCFEVDERLSADGLVVTEPSEQHLREVARAVAADKEIQAVAIVFLFSYLDPAHERLAKKIFAEEAPDLPVSISYDVLPKWKEHERASTTIADAYLKPVVAGQLSQVKKKLKASGITENVAIIKSNGGEMSVDAAAESPINLTVSGPTGGVIAGKYIAKLLGIGSLVTLDMGGTSTDCSTIVGGQESFTTGFEIEFGLPIQIPMIDIRTIGAGGGSIAWIDKGGMLRVGPQSAGAVPGPACYGKGGAEATVTDANLVLGRLNPDYFLGGTMRLDADAAHSAVERIAGRFGKSPEETAMAIVRIANINMVGALRSVLLERGLDPRDFTLMLFGGAGPLHACDLMEEMTIPRAIIPNHPGQFSAYGFILTDARVDRHRTLQLTSKRFDAARATEALRTIVAEATNDLQSQGYSGDLTVIRTLEMRYFGQNYELELPVSFDTFTPEATQGLWAQFHAQHLARFGFEIPGEIIEIVNFSATVVSATPKPVFKEIAQSSGHPKAIETRSVMFVEGRRETSVYRRAALRDGDKIEGPGLIEEAASVTVLNPHHTLRVDRFGNLLIERN